MRLKLNKPELLHYLLGAAFLLGAWVPLMTFFKGDVTLTAIAWTLWYIVIDQILHVVVKKEGISIVKR